MASLPTVEPNAIRHAIPVHMPAAVTEVYRWLRGAVKDLDHAAGEIRKELNKRMSRPSNSYSPTN